MNVDALSERVLSGFPVSIGTGLALETLFQPEIGVYDEERVVPEKKSPDDYQEFWINLSTLLRNIYSSIHAKDAMVVHEDMYLQVLLQEVEVIKRVISSQSRLMPKFYIGNYSDIGKIASFALLRVDTSVGQQRWRFVHNYVMNKITSKSLVEGLLFFDSRVRPEMRPSVIMLTHIAYDLLEVAKFTKLELLESVTGVVKTRIKFYTKLYNGKEYPTMPFNRMSLVVFGDKEQFRPNDIKLKKALLDLSIECKWTQVTTWDKIISDLDKMKNHFFIDMLKTIKP